MVVYKIVISFYFNFVFEIQGLFTYSYVYTYICIYTYIYTGVCVCETSLKAIGFKRDYLAK